jgi:hypothetical protein
VIDLSPGSITDQLVIELLSDTFVPKEQVPTLSDTRVLGVRVVGVMLQG